jgi:hypothetical protein
MKRQTIRLLLAALIVTACFGIAPSGCQNTSGINDALIVDGVSVGVSAGLSFIKDSATCNTIKNYLGAYAPGLRTITSNPTPAQLAAMIDQYTPAAIKQQYPQVVAFATPLIVNAVESAIAHYGTDNATVIKIVNDVATGLETGVASAHCP